MAGHPRDKHKRQSQSSTSSTSLFLKSSFVHNTSNLIYAPSKKDATIRGRCSRSPDLGSVNPDSLQSLDERCRYPVPNPVPKMPMRWFLLGSVNLLILFNLLMNDADHFNHSVFSQTQFQRWTMPMSPITLFEMLDCILRKLQGPQLMEEQDNPNEAALEINQVYMF